MSNKMALDALKFAEAALADIGDADREPGDDLAWCEARAAEALPKTRAAIAALQAEPQPDTIGREHVLLMLDDMGRQVSVAPTIAGNMVLQKGLRMAIGSAIDRVRSMPSEAKAPAAKDLRMLTPQEVDSIVYRLRQSRQDWIYNIVTEAIKLAAVTATPPKD